MSLSTTLRYEIDNGGNSILKQNFERQKERIKIDQMMADRENVVRLEKITTQRAEWIENLEVSSQAKRLQKEDKRIAEELTQAQKASMSIRRTALQQLLEKEHDMYEKELFTLGKTFFKQRM